MKSKNRSTGPRTPEGKKRSSLNALRHGLTGHTVVMPYEDREVYDEFCQEFFTHLRPVGPLERQFVQTIGDCSWRLNRLRAQEQNLLSFSSQQFQDQVPAEHDPALNSALSSARADSMAYEKHAKDLGALSLYEQRITRQLDHAQKQLALLQTQRHDDRQDTMFKAAALKTQHDNVQAQEPQPLPYNPQADGFVFSNSSIDAWSSVKNRFIEGLSDEDPDEKAA